MNRKALKLVPHGFLRYNIMKLLKGKPLHGYEIMKTMEKKLEWKPSPGAIYPTLRLLRKENFLKVIKNKNKRITQYKLTKKGLDFIDEFEKSSKNAKVGMKKFWLVIGRSIGLERRDIEDLTKGVERKHPAKFMLLHKNIRTQMEEIGKLIVKNAGDGSKRSNLLKILNNTKEKLKKL